MTVYILTEDDYDTVYTYGCFDTLEAAQAARDALLQEDPRRVLNIAAMPLNSTLSQTGFYNLEV